MASGRRVAFTGLAVVALVAGGGYAALRTGYGPFPDPEGCTATVGNYSVALSIDQARNASIIAAVAERRNLPARAISIAMATAYQESKLENLAGGDRDSLGLFQQRPSQGWGTRGQVLDPYYAVNAFYDALVKVDGYQSMDITEAAQAVQRSAYPDAYADHEADGRTIASALSGYSEASFSCVVNTQPAANVEQRATGLIPRADAVRRDLTTAFGDLSLGGFAGGGEPGNAEGSAHRAGKAIDIGFRPVSRENTRRGWAVAQYLVANAKRLHVSNVIFDARIWSAGTRSVDGWRPFTPSDSTTGQTAATRAVLEHRDHVHVDVW